jgi:hypothetical protein
MDERECALSDTWDTRCSPVRAQHTPIRWHLFTATTVLQIPDGGQVQISIEGHAAGRIGALRMSVQRVLHRVDRIVASGAWEGAADPAHQRSKQLRHELPAGCGIAPT